MKPPLLDTTTVPCPVCDGRSDETVMSVYGYRMARCAACGFLYVNPRPTAAALAALYSGENPYHSERYEPVAGERRVLQTLVRALRRRVRGEALLEVGCGRGDLLRAAAAAGFAASGCDFFGEDRPSIDGVRLYEGPLRTAALPEASFDVVVSRNLLEHLFDPRAELEEMARVLKPGGLLYVKVPNAAYEQGWLCRLIYRQPHVFEPPYHLNYFTAGSLRRFVETAGLRLAAWSMEPPSPTGSRSANLARETYFRAAQALAALTGGRAFPRIILVCFAEKVRLRAPRHQPMP